VHLAQKGGMAAQRGLASERSQVGLLTTIEARLRNNIYIRNEYVDSGCSHPYVTKQYNLVLAIVGGDGEKGNRRFGITGHELQCIRY